MSAIAHLPDRRAYLIYRDCQASVFLKKQNSLIGKRVAVNVGVAEERLRSGQFGTGHPVSPMIRRVQHRLPWQPSIAQKRTFRQCLVVSQFARRAISSSTQTWSETPAAIAGVIRRVLWMRAKL